MTAVNLSTYRGHFVNSPRSVHQLTAVICVMENTSSDCVNPRIQKNHIQPVNKNSFLRFGGLKFFV